MNNFNLNNNLNKIKLIPVVIYNNAYINKSIILLENKNKSGIYRWNNSITGKSYIGSSINLNVRLRAYYSMSNLIRITNKEQSIICEALLKYGHKNFSLDILEYCEIDILIEREQYYLDHLKPEYNLLKFAGSRLGHVPSENVRKAISTALRNKKYTCHEKIPVSKFKFGVSVKVFDKSNNKLFDFPSIKSAARHFDVSDKAISNIRDRGKSYDNYIYKFEIRDIRVWVYYFNNKLVNILDNALKASRYYNIPYTTISRYIKSDKLYENKYYFYTKDNELIDKEQYYHLKSERNIFNITNSGLGNKSTEETKQKISNTLKNRLTKLLPIKVTNIETNVIRYFANNLEAAKFLGLSVSTLVRYKNKGKTDTLGKYKSKGKILLNTYKITNNVFMNKSYK